MAEIVEEEMTLDRESLEYDIKLAEAIGRLLKNEDFSFVISKNYVDNFLFNSANILATAKADDRVRIQEKLIARSHLVSWIDKNYQNGMVAKDQLAEYDKEENDGEQE